MDESKRMELLGQRVRQAREIVGLSQEELAHQWGKKQYQISEYENGKRRIYAHDLPQLANVLNVSINYFFQDSAELDNDEVLEETLIHIFRNLGSRVAQEFAMTMLRELQKIVDSKTTSGNSS